MADLDTDRVRTAVRRELRYVRDQAAGLARRDSEQRFELRQIAKATLAAVLAWFLADRLLARETVWIAPATAVIMVHATVYQTLTNGVRRVFAVAAGVILAGSVGHLIGLTALGLLLVVPPALVAARWHRMGRHGTDVATTAVLMLSFGAASQERYLLAYVVATGVGAVCGALVNAMLWPPLYHRRPREAVRRLSGEAATLLENVAGGMREGCDLSDLPDWQQQAERLDEHLARAASAIADGAESRRYNLRGARVPEPDDYQRLLSAMSEIGVHLHALVRALAHVAQRGRGRGGPRWTSEEFGRDYAELLDLLARALRARMRIADEPARLSALISVALERADAIQEQMTEEVRTGSLDQPRGWAVTGSLLTDAERVLTILKALHAESLRDPAVLGDGDGVPDALV
ncbi:aromatic acid exporter family protein [Streptosporangium sp. NPDC050855]|uniref:aromatic acid exporter family protein n=1 Tax=Streptosporangium sp. NPDC050855 TaxID=3366194 RepID=UPI00379FA446